MWLIKIVLINVYFIFEYYNVISKFKIRNFVEFVYINRLDYLKYVYILKG